MSSAKRSVQAGCSDSEQDQKDMDVKAKHSEVLRAVAAIITPWVPGDAHKDVLSFVRQRKETKASPRRAANSGRMNIVEHPFRCGQLTDTYLRYYLGSANEPQQPPPAPECFSP
jgi:hypothetical protein